MRILVRLMLLLLVLILIENASAAITLENIKQLTTEGKWDSGKYILDGEKIMGVKLKEKEIWLMDRDGTGKEIFNGLLLAWNPDGTKLAYLDKDKETVYIKELKSGDAYYLKFKDTTFKDYGIRWLSENKIIFYLYDGIYLLETDTGKLFAYIPDVTLSPNGKQVLYINDGILYIMDTISFSDLIKDNYNYQVELKSPIDTNSNLGEIKYAYMFYNNVKTREEWENSFLQLFSSGVRLKDISDPAAYYFEFSPDGTKILLEQVMGYDCGSPVCYRVYVIDADGGKEKQIESSSSAPDKIMWTLNGKKLLLQDRGEEWIIDNDGNNKQKLEMDGNILDSHGNNLLFLKDGNLYEATLNTGMPSATSKPTISIPQQPIKVDSIEKLTDSQVNEGYPIWSPDGSKIAYLTQSDSKKTPVTSDIWIMDADGKNKKKIATNGFLPMWSPDGSKIAFLQVWDRWWMGDADLWVADTNGFGIKRVATNISFFPTWSPDGRIAYNKCSKVSTGEQCKIWIIDENGNDNIELALENSDFSEASMFLFSPDGSKIAFGQYGKSIEPTGIWIMRSDGSSQFKLAEIEPGLLKLWSPDSKKIAFATNKGETWIINVESSSKLKIIKEPLIPISWNVEGSKIVSVDFNKTASLYSLYILNSDGQSEQMLEKISMIRSSDDRFANPEDIAIFWFWPPSSNSILSPDGTKIVFFSKEAGNWDIYVAKLSGMPSITLKPTITSIPENNKIVEAANQYSKLFNSEFWGNEAQSMANALLESYTDPLSVTLKAAKDILTSVLGAAEMNSAAGIIDDLSKSYSTVSAAGNQGLLAGMDVKAKGIGGNTLSEEFTTLANLLNENRDPKQQLVVVSNKIELYRDMLQNPDKYDVSGAKEWSETVKMFTMNKNILLSMFDSAQEFIDALKINYGMEVTKTSLPSQSSKKIPGFEALYVLTLILIIAIKNIGGKQQ